MKPSSFYIFLAIVVLDISGCFAQEGNWEIIKTKNDAIARSEGGLAVSEGKLYMIGGDGSLRVEVLDPQTLVWSKKSSAPIAMNHFQATSYNHKIYVLEAFSEGGFPNQIPMSHVYIYDTDKDVWKKGAAILPERRRAGAGAAEYHGKMYLVAGIQHGHSSGTTNMFDMYDPQTDSWISLQDAPHIRDHCSATVIKDKLYVVGGRNTSYHEANNFMAFFSKTVLEVDCYDFKTGKWTTLDSKLPLGSGGGAVVNLNNKLYYIGGERATDTLPNAPRKNTYYLDPSTKDQWTETDSLNKARNGMAAVVWNNSIYVAGGAGAGPGGPPPGNNPNGLPLPPGGSAMNSQQAGPASLEVFILKNK
jgi:N-acetylneuraminic acid mutarotase